MAELLEMTQLADEDGMAQVEVGRGGVKAGFDAQRASGLAALFKALAQVGDANDFSCAFLEQIQLFVYGKKRAHIAISIDLLKQTMLVGRIFQWAYLYRSQPRRCLTDTSNRKEIYASYTA